MNVPSSLRLSMSFLRRSLASAGRSAAPLGSLALLVALAAVPAGAGAQDDEIAVTEIVTSRAYSGADGATDPTTTFAVGDGRIYVMVRVTNSTGAEADIRVTFERAEGTAEDGTVTGGVVLHLPASRRYRTVARTSTDRPPGRYRAVVRTEDGHVIGQVEFEVTE